MGGLQYAGFIIPVLLILVFLEYWVSKKRNKEYYTFSDTIVNMCCGMMERLFDFFFIVMLYFVFDYLYENWAIFHIPNNIFTWIACLFVGDFLAYWHHRLSHEINFLWAAHIVHHQSEELNMTTVFRVSAFAVINRSFFWIWMPILGFSPAVTTSVLVFIGLYQFVTHTRLVGKLGVLENFFVTPSSHRVHHARNEKYLDKNYGHVFIIWDKMMGTFAPEEEEPDFGITTGFESSNPFWAYLHYWVNLYQRSKKFDNFADKVRVFIKPPSWAAEGEVLDGGEYEILPDGTRKKYKPKVPFRLQLYIFLNVLFTVGSFVILLINKENLSPLAVGLITTIVTFSVLAHGGVLEQKKWGLNFEYLRLALIFVLIPIALLGNSLAWLWVPAICLYVIVMTFWFLRMRNYFGEKVELTEIQPVS